MKYFMAVLIAVGAMIHGVPVGAEEVMVAPVWEDSAYKPVIEKPEIFDREFIASLRTLREHPGVVETSFTTKPLYDMCRKPRVISYPEKDLMGGTIEGYDCFIFFDGDVKRLTTERVDVEYLEHRGMKFYIPRDSAMVILNGRFLDNEPLPAGSQAESCDACSTNKDSRITTCMMKDEPLNPPCRVIRYADMNAMALWGLTYERSLGMCHHYAEGNNLSVTGDVCQIKALGDGKINADCATRFGIDADDGVSTIFVSGAGDGFIKMTNQDTVYAGEGVNLIFVDNRVDPAQRGKVVTAKDEMPCMRIITAPQGF